MFKLFTFLFFVVIFSGQIFSQHEESDSSDVTIQAISLSGPRIGATFLSDAFVQRIKEKHNMDLNPLIAQFGWQIEKRFFTIKNGATAVSEWVILVGGFEQEKFLPSITWILGFRTSDGFEFGAGPNLSLSGSSVVFALGYSFQTNELNFPLNFTVATSKTGPRYSLLIGYNLK